jgi:hypothetical protein
MPAGPDVFPGMKNCCNFSILTNNELLSHVFIIFIQVYIVCLHVHVCMFVYRLLN